jgi:hypothetical protein
MRKKLLLVVNERRGSELISALAEPEIGMPIGGTMACSIVMAIMSSQPAAVGRKELLAEARITRPPCRKSGQSCELYAADKRRYIVGCKIK